MTSGRCRGRRGLGDGVRERVNGARGCTETAEEAETLRLILMGALLRDTGGIRSILLAALIDERLRVYTYTQTDVYIIYTRINESRVHPVRPLDHPVRPCSLLKLSTGRGWVFSFQFFSSFFISRLQRAIDLLCAMDGVPAAHSSRFVIR